jgi:hypothetical protein
MVKERRRDNKYGKGATTEAATARATWCFTRIVPLRSFPVIMVVDMAKERRRDSKYGEGAARDCPTL